jgi:hypothetical protein
VKLTIPANRVIRVTAMAAESVYIRSRHSGNTAMSGLGYRIIAFFGISALCTAVLALPYVTSQ